MRPPTRRSLLVGLAAGVLALGACNAILGVEGGSPVGTGGDAGDAGPRGDASCSDAGFPTTPVLDGFNRADGMLGPSWSVDTPGGFAVAGDQLFCSAGTPGIMVWPTVFGATQEAYLTLVAFDPGDMELELILKNQGMITECDSLEIDFQPDGMGAGTGMLGIYGCTAGNPLTFATIPLSLTPGDVFGARACADGTLEVFKNGQPVHAPWDVSAFPYAKMGGRIGFFSSGLTAAARLDDFGGGTTP